MPIQAPHNGTTKIGQTGQIKQPTKGGKLPNIRKKAKASAVEMELWATYDV
jgi:hypothetical protein